MTNPRGVPDDVLGYVRNLSGALAAVSSDLIGVYLHGSAVMGGFRPSRSDVDVLAVVSAPGTVAQQRAMGEAVAAVDGCPGAGLEMSVVTAATAADLGDCPFEVHVNTADPSPVIVAGGGHARDPDLVLHAAVCRQRGLAVSGPPPHEVFGPVPRDRVLGAMTAEVRWGLRQRLPTYTVLNACLAARYADDGLLCSKVDGAEWYLTRDPGNAVVAAALRSQRDGGEGPTTEDAARFVAHLWRLSEEAEADLSDPRTRRKS